MGKLGPTTHDTRSPTVQAGDQWNSLKPIFPFELYFIWVNDLHVESIFKQNNFRTPSSSFCIAIQILWL